MSLHRIRLDAVVELPDDEDTLFDLYGTNDPASCIQMDFDNDPPAFLLEQADEMELIYEGLA